jgi:hypothetical protein
MYEALDEIFEFKERKKKRKDSDKYTKPALAAAQLYAGKRALEAGAERVLGVQRFVHGSSKEGAKSILKEGLKGSHGGSAKGSSAGLAGDKAIDDLVGGKGASDAQAKFLQENSKGRAYVFKDTPLRRRLASAHASLAEEKKGMKSMIKGALGVGGGKKVYGEMSVDDFKKRMELDPDYGGGESAKKAGAYRTKRQDLLGTPDTIKPMSKRRGSLVRLYKARSKNIPNYMRNNKGRALLGLASILGSGALGTAAYKNVKKSREAWKDEKKAK